MLENRAQNCLKNSGPDIISTKMWPLNSPQLNPLDYHVRRNVGGFFKTEDHRRTDGNAAGDSVTPGTTD